MLKDENVDMCTCGSVEILQGYQGKRTEVIIGGAGQA